MKYYFFVILVLSFFTHLSYALGLADFTPSFLLPKESQAIKNNNSAIINNNPSINNVIINKCDQPIVENKLFPNSVVYKQIESSNNLNITVLANNKHLMTEKPIDDNRSIDNNSIFTINPTTVNQTALQDQEVRNAINSYKSTYMLSIKPEDNINMSMGLNELQLSIKY